MVYIGLLGLPLQAWRVKVPQQSTLQGSCFQDPLGFLGLFRIFLVFLGLLGSSRLFPASNLDRPRRPLLRGRVVGSRQVLRREPFFTTPNSTEAPGVRCQKSRRAVWVDHDLLSPR